MPDETIDLSDLHDMGGETEQLTQVRGGERRVRRFQLVGVEGGYAGQTWSSVGDGCEIGPDTRPVDCVVEADCVIQNSVGHESEVGANANVGPYAHLAPGSVVAAGARTGAFYTPPIA